MVLLKGLLSTSLLSTIYKQGFTQAKFEFAFSTQWPLISDSRVNVEEKERQTLR